MDKSKLTVIILTIILIFSGMLIKHVRKSNLETIRCYSKKNRFSIAFPYDWNIREESKKTMMAVSPKRDGARASICIYVERLTDNEDTEQNFEKWLSDHIVHQRDEVMIGNNHAQRAFATTQTTWRNKPVEMRTVHYYLVNKNYFYLIMCTARPNSAFAGYRDKFEEIAQSFRFE